MFLIDEVKPPSVFFSKLVKNKHKKIEYNTEIKFDNKKTIKAVY